MAAALPPRLPHLPRQLPRVAREEPGKLPAALLATIVHAAFFSVIVFGVSWQVKHPDPVMAELWDQLPSIRNAPEPPAPEPEPEVKKIVEPPPIEKASQPQPTKADIQLKAKQEMAEREKVERERAEKARQAELEKKRKVEDAQRKAAKAADDKAKSDQAAHDAAVSASRSAAQRDYADKIASLIRNRANIPDTVTGKPVLTVRVRLLVNGVVFDVAVTKPSGNRVYDEAVERAINGIRQWPLPEIADLFGSRRELNLNIEHER